MGHTGETVYFIGLGLEDLEPFNTGLGTGTSWQCSTMSGRRIDKSFSVGLKSCPQAQETEQALSGIIGSDGITVTQKTLMVIAP